MKAYLPLKWHPDCQVDKCDSFKKLQKILGHNEYHEGDCETFKATNIFTEKFEEYPSTPSVKELVDDIFDKYLVQDFKGHKDSVNVIVRCFEAVQHRDAAWTGGLFLSLVVNADPAGHVITAASSVVSGKLNLANSRMILKPGDIFLMDPWAIHSVQNRSKEKKELVIVQWEIELGSREKALAFLENTRYEFVNLA